ncbi:MAG: hypothetical protein DRJ42_02095 [Deltaproteobacteria bacterium]|nr:MAG: hypothetical protein DRJ42_02095 [Deltaproteobacteria bacterium]
MTNRNDRTALFGLAALLTILAACTAGVPPAADLTKDEARDEYASGPKADGVDYCEDFGWYGDGECDTFCPLIDHDCTDDECTPGADSTCSAEEICVTSLCDADCPAESTTCCVPATCRPVESVFCATTLCGPGTECDEDLEECVPVESCTTAFTCPAGSVCDEASDRCMPVACPAVVCEIACAYGLVVGADGCEVCECAPIPELFCPTARCAAGTVCDEAARACVPVACPAVVCEIACDNGLVVGADGCEVCECAPAPDCRADGCASGSSCSFCWGTYQCIPDGAIC